MTSQLTPTLLLILDGWGQAPKGPGNAVRIAKMPTIDSLLTLPSKTLLSCSGRDVGLPTGFMGNSEVGHLNIGAGRIVYQDMTLIDVAIEDGHFASNPVITQTIAGAKKHNGRLHLMGLLSDGGVHSHITHLKALIGLATAAGVEVALHMFMDGRDTGPTTGAGYMQQVIDCCSQSVRVASFIGRYYAMDRDKRWERTKAAWDMLVNGDGKVVSDPVAALQAYYAAGTTDEFIPATIVTTDGNAPCTIQDGDAVFFFNFRADRARQLTRCLSDATFAEFDRKKRPAMSFFATMTAYDANLPVPCAFEKQNLVNTLGEVLSNYSIPQLHMAETEKYAHVTYFFNGGREAPFPGEKQVLIPSPKEVPTYDLKPEMSVDAVTAQLIEAWNSGDYPFIVCNIANLDMVGHTGKIPAVIKACKRVDSCVARILEAVRRRKGRMLLTADHGNAEEMLTLENTPQTAHSKNKVALIVVDEETRMLKSGGKLADIAPTILHLWGIPLPAEMTGTSLWEIA